MSNTFPPPATTSAVKPEISGSAYLRGKRYITWSLFEPSSLSTISVLGNSQEQNYPFRYREVES